MPSDKKNKDQFVDEGLKKEPDFFLSDNFAEKIAGKVEKRMVWNLYIKEFLIYVSAILGIALTVPVIIFLFDEEALTKLLDFLLSYINIIIGVGILLLFVLFSDKVLLRYFSHKAKFK